MSLVHRAEENLLATAGLFLAATALGLLSVGGLLARGVFALLGWSGPVGGTLGAFVPVFVAGLLLAVPVAWLSILGLSYGVVSRLSPRVKRTARRVRLAVEELVDDATRLTAEGTLWLGRTARDVERDDRFGDVTGVSTIADTVDPRTAETRADDRIERLNEQYLAGDISEGELDRRVEDVLDEEAVGHAEASTLDDHLDAVAAANED
jgi:uncharacterized membrane protein